MIIRHEQLPGLMFEVYTDEDARLAERRIEEKLELLRTGQFGIPAVKPKQKAAKAPSPRPSRNSDPLPSSFDVKKVLGTLARILWSYDITALRTIKVERTRRKVVEAKLSGHSFNKVESRWAKAAEAAGGTLEDLVFIDRVHEGMLRKTWFSAGPMLVAIPDEALKHLEAELKKKEEKKKKEEEAKQKRSSTKQAEVAI